MSLREIDTYQTPLNSRYASVEMRKLFGARTRAGTWRKLWLWLAEAEQELGIPNISNDALEEMRANLDVTEESLAVAAAEEKRRRHDVMAHVHAFGQLAPKAAGIIHLGATSCYVTDNADLIFLRDALDIILPKLAKVMHNLCSFAMEHKDLPTLGFTHYQPAQLITVGKRAAQWVQELMMDLEDIEHVRSALKFRGAQGTTGTQASFMELFHGDQAKIDQLNTILCKKAGFPACYDVSTQTYTRKVDLRVANAIAALGTTAYRIAVDIRLLANQKEMEEPFEKDQIGSSAMAYKRNPMRCERMCALSRKLSNVNANFAETFMCQWFERTLDDSAIRRMDIPEMFLLADSILTTLDNVTDGLVVYPARINAHVMEELPFMATENILMKMTEKGHSRQEGHEQIRVLSHQASAEVKQKGGKNDLVERMKKNEWFKPVWDQIDSMLDPKLFIGRSSEIVEKFCGPNGVVEKKTAKYNEYIKTTAAAQLSV